MLYRHYFGLRACVLHGFNVQDLFHLVWNDFKSFTESEICGVDSGRSPVIISVFLFSGFKVTVSESIKLLYFGWFFYLSVVGKYHFLCSVSHVFRGNSKCEFRALSLLRYLISIISCFPNWFSLVGGIGGFLDIIDHLSNSILILINKTMLSSLITISAYSEISCFR